MRARVTIVDYGRGNLFSLCRALRQVGAETVVSSDPGEIASAERLLLPGVGSFGDGMTGLRDRGLFEPIRRFQATGRPLLGICLGMQLLMSESSEFGRHEGLNLVPGKVERFDDPRPGEPPYKIPQVGWNEFRPAPGRSWGGTALEGLPQPAFMYFVHSYVAKPDRPEHDLAHTRYGGNAFCSVLSAGNILGCQFHPERSAEAGLALLKNWISFDLVPPTRTLEALR